MVNHIITIQEHDVLSDFPDYKREFDKCNLIKWSLPYDSDNSRCQNQWAYYAYYRIGAEWLDNDNALIVAPKKGMENLDFISMFMACYNTPLENQSFSAIYNIDWNTKRIEAPSFRTILSPLIIIHFLAIVKEITKKGLKHDYIYKDDNLKKVKGRINIIQNERTNILRNRANFVNCHYSERSENIPENRIIKKALLLSKGVIGSIKGNKHSNDIGTIIQRELNHFRNVNDYVELSEVKVVKGNKLYKSYSEAIRLAKMILRFFDNSVNQEKDYSETIPCFWIDMSLLFEHYVYNQLFSTYKNEIIYQFKAHTGVPDFLRSSIYEKIILDTKYIPRFINQKIDSYIIKQLGGYSRDLQIIKRLGVTDLNTVVPCVILYPSGTSKGKQKNPFIGHSSIINLCEPKEDYLINFFKFGIVLPELG